MKTAKILTILVMALGLLAYSAQLASAGPMGTAFTYQGHLYDANYAANGQYDFAFKLYDANVAGSKVGTDVNVADVDVIDAYFTVELDFGSSVFDGNAVWLEIGVRPGEMNDPNGYTTLSPRQEVTPTPYALQTRGIFVDDAGNVGVGTSSPEKRLDIASESYTNLGIGLNIKSPGGTSWDIDNDEGVFKIVEHASCGPEFLNNTRIAVVGNCIGSPYGGNVGIGTTNPLEKLHIDGNLCFTEKGVARTIYVEKSDGVDERGRDLEIYAGECNAQIIETLSGGDLKLHGGRGEGIAGGNVYIYGGEFGTSPVGNVILAHNGTDAGGKVGIGTTEPDEKLHVAGSVKIVDGSQGAGKVLTSDAAGVASWQNLQVLPGGVPSGIIVMWSGSIGSIPDGWALCDGTNGTPDLRDRFIVGAGNEYSIGNTGGEKMHTLTIAEMPSHTHTGRFADQREDSSGDDTTYHVNKGATTNSGSTGGDQPHENRPPYYALAFIMKLP
jgi:microcystin-dependent protein